MVYAIPMFLYVNANSDQEALQHKKELEKKLANPFVKSALQPIPERGFIIQDPIKCP